MTRPHDHPAREVAVSGNEGAVLPGFPTADWPARRDAYSAYGAEGARLMGVTYDHYTDSLEFSLDVGDHRVLGPQEVWTVEEPDGFLDSIEVVRADGVREAVTVKRVGLRRLM